MKLNQQTPTADAVLQATERMIAETQQIIATLQASRSCHARSVDAARIEIVKARRALREAPQTS